MKPTSFSLERIFIYALMISSLVLSLSPGMGPVAFAQSPLPPDPGAGGTLTPPPPHVTTDPETGVVRFMGGSKQAPLALTSTADAAAKSPREIAEGFLQVRGSAFGLGTGSGLSVLRETSAADGRAFERFQQTYQGVPVLGGELIVQMDAGKNVLSTSGRVASQLNLDVTPGLDAAAAQAAALAAARAEYPELAADQLAAAEATLYVYDTLIYDRLSAPAQKLVWQVVVSTKDDPNLSQTVFPVRQEVLVDAHSGGIVRQFSTLDTALNRKIYDCNGGTDCLEYHLEGKPFVSYSTDGNHAYDYIGDTYQFYKDTFGRDSVDGKGMALVAKFNYTPYLPPTPLDPPPVYHNAFWNGSALLFGQGYVVLDLTAHELTHAITANESKLVYLDQSGAINESLSDTFGQFVEKTYQLDSNWLIGEDVNDSAPYSPPFRDMANPPAHGTDYNPRDPDMVGSSDYYCGFDDNGGVHTNSGVGNKAAYLITDGTLNEPGNVFNNQTITGLGIDKAAKLYYDVQTNLLTSKAEYPDLADALENSCSSLFGSGSPECISVGKAIAATQMDQTPCLGVRGYISPLATFVTSPIGNISSAPQPLNPPLVWRQRTDATAYQLSVKDSHARVIYQGWKANDLTICPNATCTASLPFTLKYGEHYSWAVQTRNPLGDGPWSPSKTFYALPGGAPGLVGNRKPAEADVLDAVRPPFTWDAVSGATGYLLKIEQVISLPAPANKPYLSMTLSPELACPSGTTCTALPSRALAALGSYRWSVAAKFGAVSGPPGDWINFSVEALPAQVTITEPTGQVPVTSLTPSLHWSLSARATEYWVTILGTAGKIMRKYDPGVVCNLTDCSTDLPRLDGGKQIVTVQAFSKVGLGPISAARTFFISAPDTATNLTAPPEGFVSDSNRPVFAWDVNSLATSYTLQVTGPVPFKKTYKASDINICDASACHAPAEVTFRPVGAVNSYSWSVTAVNKAGGLISAVRSFTVPPAETAPLAPKPSLPALNERVDVTQPLFLQWTGDVAYADQYILKLSGPNHYFSQRFIPAPACPLSVCTWLFPDALALGRYTWSLTGSNHGVLGKTSAVSAFTLVLPPPQINAPAADSSQSAYQLSALWDPVSQAMAYNVQLLNKLNRVLFNKTLLASGVCSASACSTLLPPGLPIDTGYRVVIKALHATGFGLPSINTFDFSLIPSTTFDAEFNALQDVWQDVGPTEHWYWSANHKYWTNPGAASSLNKGWEFLANDTSYSDSDTRVALRRLGCSTCSTSLVVRSGFYPGTRNLVNGYRFDIRGDGRFRVVRAVGGQEYVLQAWTPSLAVHRGAGWNILRVVALGHELWFQINGTLVWYGKDINLDLGKTAMGMDSIGPADELNIDWARSYTPQALTTAAQLGQVGALQQALNQAANAQAAGASR